MIRCDDCQDTGSLECGMCDGDGGYSLVSDEGFDIEYRCDECEGRGYCACECRAPAPNLSEAS